MPLREIMRRPQAPFAPLLAKEVRDLLAGRAFWVLLLLLALLSGYGFQQAVLLYSEASRTATDYPVLARGLSPFDGIVVPTFGALYLVTTLLFPFVAIRTIGAEKQNGGQKLLLQLPYSIPTVLAAKLAVLGLAWLAMAILCLSAILLWVLLGGHVGMMEAANVLLGHFLYASVVASIGLLAASLAQSSATAAIIALAATLGFWVLDFAATGDSGILKALSGLSLTVVLREFERGIFSAGATLATMVAAAGLIALAGVWWPTGKTLTRKMGLSLVVLLVTIAAGFGASSLKFYSDATEDRRNSFEPADMASLRRLDRQLTVIVNLASGDPRYIDFERGVLGKLRRTVPDIKVIQGSENRLGLFMESKDAYGEIIYRYGGREAMSRSTGAGEVLPLIYKLARIERPGMPAPEPYPGYPLVADPKPAALWFYGILPLTLGIAGAWTQRRRQHSI